MTDQERIAQAWVQVRSVNDPEIPYLTVEEMGMVRGLRVEDGQLVVTITPTYSGCPATDVIAEGVVAAVKEVGLKVPLVVRLEGTNVEAGKDIINNSGLDVIAADNLSDGAEKIVKAVKG